METICFPSRIAKSVALFSDISLKSTVRGLIATSLCISLVALRSFTTLLGIICPELVYNLLHIHELLLFLGLWRRMQKSDVGNAERTLFQDISLRFHLALRITSAIEHNISVGSEVSFPLLLSTTQDAHRTPVQYITPKAMPDLTTFQDFKEVMMAYIEQSIDEVKELYSNESIASMEVNVMYAVFDRALWKTLSAHIRVDGEKLFFTFCGKEHEVTSGKLFDKKADIIAYVASMKLLSEQEKALFPLYLYNEDELISKKLEGFPARAKPITACYKNIVQIRSTLIERSFSDGDFPARLQKAFSVECDPLV